MIVSTKHNIVPVIIKCRLTEKDCTEFVLGFSPIISTVHHVSLQHTFWASLSGSMEAPILSANQRNEEVLSIEQLRKQDQNMTNYKRIHMVKRNGIGNSQSTCLPYEHVETCQGCFAVEIDRVRSEQKE